MFIILWAKTHMQYGITQCYLPPGRGDIPIFIPSQLKLALNLTTPEGCKAELTYDWLGYIPSCYTHPKTVTHPSTNRAQRRVTLLMRRYDYVKPPSRQWYIAHCAPVRLAQKTNDKHHRRILERASPAEYIHWDAVAICQSMPHRYYVRYTI